MWLTSSNPRKAIVVTVLVILTGAAIVSFVSAHRYSTGQDWIIHTYQALLTVDEVSVGLSNAIGMSQAYVISGDKAEIKNLDAQLASIAALSSRLQLVTIDNPRQKARLAELRPLMDARLDLLTQSVELEERQPGARALQSELLRKGAALDRPIQSLIASIREDERQLLVGRSTASALTQNRFINMLLVTFSLAAALFFGLFVVMSREASRRGRAEAAAKENEEKFRLLVSSVQDYAILHLDLDGRVTTWNLGAEHLFGYTTHDILGWPIGSLFQSCDQGTLEDHMQTALRDGHTQADCQQLRQDGTTFWATIDLTLLRDPAGRPRGYTMITRDITERRQQELEVSRREAELEAFFSNAPVGLAIIDSDLRFQRINGPFSKLNRLPPEQNEGLYVGEVAPELATELESLIRQVVATGEPVLNHEVKKPNPTNPNSVGWWLKSIFPITREDGVVRQVGAVVQDVTALKRAENTVRWLSGRLLQLRDDERRRLARDLHDSLGQVLSAVKMNLSYLSRAAEQPNERSREAIAESKSLVESCIQEVRTLSHLLHPPMLDEVGLLSAIRWFVNGFSQRSGVEVRMDLPQTMQRLPNELEIALFRALQESLTNVHRHSGSQTAAVSLKVGVSRVQLEVADQGCGIPPQKLTVRQEHASIGIGILGMRERVRQLGGELEISSAQSGTTVHLTFPVPEVA